MSLIESTYINALLADASYVSLAPGLSGTDLANNLGLNTRMTTAQATFIANNFEVLDSIETPRLLGSGFDAVVWRGTKNRGQVLQSNILFS